MAHSIKLGIFFSIFWLEKVARMSAFLPYFTKHMIHEERREDKQSNLEYHENYCKEMLKYAKNFRCSYDSGNKNCNIPLMPNKTQLEEHHDNTFPTGTTQTCSITLSMAIKAASRTSSIATSRSPSASASCSLCWSSSSWLRGAITKGARVFK